MPADLDELRLLEEAKSRSDNALSIGLSVGRPFLTQSNYPIGHSYATVPLYYAPRGIIVSVTTGISISLVNFLLKKSAVLPEDPATVYWRLPKCAREIFSNSTEWRRCFWACFQRIGSSP